MIVFPSLLFLCWSWWCLPGPYPMHSSFLCAPRFALSCSGFAKMWVLSTNNQSKIPHTQTDNHIARSWVLLFWTLSLVSPLPYLPHCYSPPPCLPCNFTLCHYSSVYLFCEASFLRLVLPPTHHHSPLSPLPCLSVNTIRRPTSKAEREERDWTGPGYHTYSTCRLS